MKCACEGILKKKSKGHKFYVVCSVCRKVYTWQEYRELQADLLIKVVKEGKT